MLCQSRQKAKQKWENRAKSRENPSPAFHVDDEHGLGAVLRHNLELRPGLFVQFSLVVGGFTTPHIKQKVSVGASI